MIHKPVGRQNQTKQIELIIEYEEIDNQTMKNDEKDEMLQQSNYHISRYFVPYGRFVVKKLNVYFKCTI